jgi:AAA domain
MFKDLNETLDAIEAKEKAANAEETPAAKHKQETPTSSAGVNQKPAKVLRELKGGSVIDYANMPIDHSATLLGDRFLCRGGGMFIVAPSGQGKSTLAVQLAAEWALAWASLGIPAHGALRTLIIQAEDDAGDITEMSAWIKNHDLSDDQKIQIARNTHIELVNDVVGPAFIDTLDEILQQWPCDIVIINPYTFYLGDDAKDEKSANDFLRARLNPVLAKHGCATIIMHHTPKTNYASSEDYTTSELMYRGSGCATMSNWARAYVVFEPLREDESIFKFTAAKRGRRIGWSSFRRYFKHSDNGDLRWIALSAEESAKLEARAVKEGGKPVDLDKIFALIPVVGEVERKLLIYEVTGKLKVGEKKAANAIDLLEAQGRVARNYRFADNSGKKGGRKSIFLSRNDNKEEVGGNCA